MSKGVNLWLTASLGLLLGLLSPVFFVFSSVSAASPADNVIRQGDMTISTTSCDYENFDGTTSYASLPYANNSTFASYMDAAFDAGQGWAVSQYVYRAADGKEAKNLVYYVSVTPETAKIRYTNSYYPNGYFYLDNTVKAEITCEKDSNNQNKLKVYYNLSPANREIAYSWNETDGSKLVFANSPIEYPPGYAGHIPPDTFTPTSVHYPQFSYAVDDKHVSATYLQNIPYDNTTLINMHWELFKKNGSNYDPINDKWHPAYGVYEYDVTEFGDYRLKLSFSVKPPGILPDDITVKSITQDFVVDGSTYASSTTKTDCTNGTCAPPSVYEDCSTYGVDLIGGFGCQMRNFGKWLQWLFTFLFIPSASSLTSLFDEANGFLHQKLGLLLYPFDWFGLVFNSMMNSVTSCAGMNVSAIPGVQQNGTFFGSHVNLNPCSAQQNFPQLYNIAVFFIRIFIVFAMVVAVHRKLLATINDHGSRGERLYG